MSPWSEVKTTTVFSAKPQVFQRLQELADLLVEVGDRREIGAAGVADVLLRHVEAPEIAGFEDPPRMRVVRFVGDARAGHRDVRVAIEIPIFLPHDVGVVRVREAHGQAEGAAVALAGEVEELLAGEMRDLVVIFELVGHLGHARLR